MIEVDRLTMFVIYDHPRDFPEEFVCRRCAVDAAGPVFDRDLFARGQTLEEVRAQLPGGQVRFERSPCDDPVIVETWF